MALVIPTLSANRMLAHILNAETPQDLVLKLFENDREPEPDDTAEDYREPGGYTSHLLAGFDWNIAEGKATAPVQVFQFRGFKGDVHGYFVVTGASGKLMWAERFSDGPYRIQNNGDKVTVLPRITLKSDAG